MSTARAEFPAKLKFLFSPSRYKVPYGGRGSGKSWGIARALLVLGSATRIRILCAREFQKSIQDSVHKLLSDQIASLGLSAHYRVLQYTIRNPYTGTEFIFEGLHSNITKIKSMEGINIVWVEEAEKVTKASWDALIPTIRRPWEMPGHGTVSSEIWVSYNPNEETDNTHQRFVVAPPPTAVVKLINWRDNPYFPSELLVEKDYMAKVDPDGYQHIWEGKCRKSSAAQVLRDKYIIEAFEPCGDWEGPYHGTDWGFSTDPMAAVKCWVHDCKLYIEYEAYGHGVETDDTPKVLERIPGIQNYVNRADNARPETISYVRRHEHPRIVAVDKWPGSIEDGVSYLRQFEQIVIHPRCEHTALEARLWAYKVDKNTEDVLPELEDKNNHCWDAVRYAIAPLIKNVVKFAKKWWRTWTSLASVEARITIKMITVTLDEVVAEGAAELGAVFQLWGVEADRGMYLLAEQPVWGTLPVLLDEIVAFWTTHAQTLSSKPTSEVWVDNKSVGPTFLKLLRKKGLPAREWDPEDKMVVDVAYRAKQASLHIAEGRIFVPADAAVMTEIAGLSTDAMTLAVAIWSQRGGGRGEIPIPFEEAA